MKSGKEYKVVFQLSNNDTFIHKSLIRQLSNLLTALQGVTVEVVAHSYGIDFLLKDSPFKDNIEVLAGQGVEFMVCQNTLKEGKTDPAEILPLAKIIPAGIAHVVVRQSEGWGYIKAG